MTPRRRINSKAVATQLFLLVLIALLVVRVMFFRPVVVTQRSMEDTLFEEDRLLVNVRAYDHALPERGSIVVLEHPEQRHWIVKRVIGLPGEVVQVTPDGLELDGRLLTEDYAKRFREVPREAVTVPPDSVFVIGDNRGQSEDSRDFGPVPRSKLIGEVVAVMWPREHRRWIRPELPR